MVTTVSEVVAIGGNITLKPLQIFPSEHDAVAFAQLLATKQDGKQYQVNTQLHNEPTYLAVIAVPVAYHAGFDASACHWTPIGEHDSKEAAMAACKAYTHSGQPYDAFMVVSSISSQYPRLKARLQQMEANQ